MEKYSGLKFYHNSFKIALFPAISFNIQDHYWRRVGEYEYKQLQYSEFK